MSKIKDGRNQAKFCSLNGRFSKKLGRISLKLVILIASIIPNKNAIAVTGAITCEGFFQNFQEKLSRMTTIAGG